MKYILTKKQYSFLLEQSSYEKGIWDRSTTMLNKMSNLDTHTVANFLSIATFFIPVVGPAISAGISLGDAALYYKEGDKKTATMVALFPFLPFGKIGKLIPNAQKLGKEGMENLAKKIGKEGGKGLTQIEREVADGLIKNKEILNQEMKRISDDLLKNSKRTISELPLGNLGKDFKELASKQTGWIQATNPIGNYSGWKFHVYADNLDEVAFLYEKLLPVVNQHGAGMKLASSQVLDRLATNAVQKGKGVTIYLPSNVVAKNSQREFLKDIQSVLKDYKKSGQISGDRMITDNIGYRYELSKPINGARGVDSKQYQSLYKANKGGGHNIPGNPDLFR